MAEPNARAIFTFEISKILVTAQVHPIRMRSHETRGKSYISCWIVDWVTGGPLEVKLTSMTDTLVSIVIWVGKTLGI